MEAATPRKERDAPALDWPAGGALLGGVLLLAVAVAQPLGVSTQYVRAVGGACELAAPGSGTGVPYFKAERIVFGYAEMVVLGVIPGALLAALATGRLGRAAAVPSTWRERFGASKGKRFLAAAAGGALLLFGARLAGGCTSGHILSGVSQMAVSSLLFAIAAFGGGVLFARLLYGGGGRR
jgi:uncharacterized membrane protein YedE/YeeE